ncbi:hypothetical protein [Sandaracinus amylolyticus]|uniref:Uncharacterized protein n=1 Tax=Sandaracinus amylolyticus TaxID=927083 RepID=A0A0F6YLZ5_9BACT|nr:hypothetical protein [Sandaracinus amylolyticus]AKF10107.1 hypothetical protein DB32_007256 [Sandaracinus amylolyticus]
MKRFVLAITMTLLLGLVSAPPRARGQSVGDAAVDHAISGAWSLATREPDARGTIERAIDRAIDGMLPFVRGMAQGELRARTPIDRDVAIDLAPERIEVRLGANAFATAPGRPRRMPVPGYAGETVEVVHLVRGGRLEQIFSTDQGRRWNVFAPSADGQRLTLDVTMSGALLPAPVQYRLEYRRAD